MNKIITKLGKLISLATCVLPALYGCAGVPDKNTIDDPFGAPINTLLEQVAVDIGETPPLPTSHKTSDAVMIDRHVASAARNLDELSPEPPTLPLVDDSEVVQPFFETIEPAYILNGLEQVDTSPDQENSLDTSTLDVSLQGDSEPVDEPADGPIVSYVPDSSSEMVAPEIEQPVAPVAPTNPPEVSEQLEQSILAEQPVVTAVPIEAAPGYVADSEETNGYIANNVYPIDLSNALGLGGANHLQIQMARERAVQAHADLIQARVLTLPSLRFGYGWNKHDGRLQQTDGDIVEVSRGSHFVGGGAGLGQVPLAGAASGPARFMVNLSLSDAFFQRKVAQNLHYAASKESSAVFNDSLLQIANRYMNMLEAHGRYANAQTGVSTLEQMVEIATAFEESGEATLTEVDRARTQLSLQQRRLANLDRLTKTSSAELVRLLRLDPTLVVVPAEVQVMQLELIDASLQIPELLAIGLANRPETCQQQGLVWAAGQRVQQENWRPWLPHVQLGTSAGQFGGGQGADFRNRGGRSDIDVLAIWEVQNLGLGNKALRQRSNSELREACLHSNWVRDQIESEIVASANDVASYREQIQIAYEAAERARDTYEMNLVKIQGGEGLPLELIQAINSLVESLDAYVASVCDYNRAQFRMLRAIGQPPSA